MKYLKVFTDFAVKMKLLSDAERGRLFTAMLEYAESGAEPDLRGNERFLWEAAKSDIDRQAESYNKRCEVNKTIATNRYESSRIVTNRAKTKKKTKTKTKTKTKKKQKKKYQRRRLTRQWMILPRCGEKSVSL